MHWEMLTAFGTLGVLAIAVLGWIRNEGKRTQILEGHAEMIKDHEMRIREIERDLPTVASWRHGMAGSRAR